MKSTAALKLATTLDSIADRLETQGLMKEAYEIDIISNTIDYKLSSDIIDASVIETIKNKAKMFLSKIPGAKMMSPNEANAILEAARQKDPRGTKSLIDEVMKNLQGLAATSPLTGREANDKEAAWGSFMKGITNPRVLIAVLSLLASTGSALGATPGGISPADTTKQEQVSSMRFDVPANFRSEIEKINKDGTGKDKPMKFNTIVDIPGTNKQYTFNQKNENEYAMVIKFNQANEKLRQAVANGQISEEDHGKAVKDMIASYDRITSYARSYSSNK